jgi:predicted alpha/beta-hydrolase family hydrolase
VTDSGTTRAEIDTPSGPAWVDLDLPVAAPKLLVVLGHGAGGGVEALDLIAVRDAAVAAGIATARVTQPYRVAGRRAPVPAPRLDEAWIAVLAHLREAHPALALVAGGRSSGARVACRTAAAVGAVAVVALAFPVHPPGRPDSDRLDELALPRVPVLVVQGDRDPFGQPPRRRGRRVVMIPGADHSLKKDTGAVAEAVTGFLLTLR